VSFSRENQIPCLVSGFVDLDFVNRDDIELGQLHAGVVHLICVVDVQIAEPLDSDALKMTLVCEIRQANAQ
jgi:hypothetical protein